MELKITEGNVITTKYSVGNIVYEEFEIKRKKISSVVFGDIATRLKRTNFDLWANKVSQNSVYAYELTTGQIYSESEIFRTEDELKEKLLRGFTTLFKKEEIATIALSNPTVVNVMKKLIGTELRGNIKEELKNELVDSVKKEIAKKEYPKVVEEIRNEVHKKFALTFDDFANKCLVTN